VDANARRIELQQWPTHRKLFLALNGTSTTNTWTILFKGDSGTGTVLSGLQSRRTKLIYKVARILNAIIVKNLSVATLNWLLERDEVLIVEQVCCVTFCPAGKYSVALPLLAQFVR
jgi:hypothetical protein